MRTEEFDYSYPSNLVATQPARSRLLRYSRQNKEIQHDWVENLDQRLREDDLLVFNNSEVLPARFFGQKRTGAKIEGLFLGTGLEESRVWIKGRVKEGDSVLLQAGPEVKLLSKNGREAVLDIELSQFVNYLREEAFPALPPYIVHARREQTLSEFDPQDAEHYQTEFAQKSSDYSVAAPTASLHFKGELLKRLQLRKPAPEYLQLFVGAGTFAPLESEQIEDHPIHAELVRFPEGLWKKIIKHKESGGRVIAIGTTVMRALEARVLEESDCFWTKLYIQPGFEFRVVDSLITNFHQPKSSLLVLVASFMEAGAKDLTHEWRRVYAEALNDSYRLFSYGDAMWIE